jgi:hypothetical protein
MLPLTYYLQFTRPAGAGEETYATAEGVQITTTISAEGISAQRRSLPGVKAQLQNQVKILDEETFDEWGKIVFGNDDNWVSFKTIGVGYLRDNPDPKYKSGTVMWSITQGGGFFKGASGSIVSNFLVDLKTNELIDNHVGLIYIPAT